MSYNIKFVLLTIGFFALIVLVIFALCKLGGYLFDIPVGTFV